MSEVTLAEASAQYGGFYVPQFEVHIGGSALPGNVLRDVVEITYKDKLEEIDSCELVVNNWDADHGCFKYIGSEDLDPDSGKPAAAAASNPNAGLWNLFDPCAKDVTVKLGYAPGPLATMIHGNFVTYEPNFPASGPPVLSVRMLNGLHKLRAAKHDEQYTTKTIKPLNCGTIAEYLGKKKRLPVDIVVEKSAKAKGADLNYVIQKSQYDIDFLWQRARAEGLELFIDDEGDGKLHVRASTAKDTPVYQLSYGQSLIDFKPTLTVGNQFKTVIVRGWDRAAQKVIDVKVEYDKDPDTKNLNKNLSYLLKQCDPREEKVVERPFYTEDEAKTFARSVFKDQLKRMVKATGTTIGLPQLRAGSKVRIGGAPGAKQSLGSRLSGMYFVTATTHTFNSSGYTTRFEARREEEETGS